MKDNVETLERKLNQPNDEKIEKLLVEGKMTQERLFKGKTKNLKATQSLGRKAILSAWLMEDGKVNKALKLLESSNKGQTLPLTVKTIKKHSKASKASSDLLIEEVQNAQLIIYDSIDSEMVRDAVKKRCSGSVGPLVYMLMIRTKC